MEFAPKRCPSLFRLWPSTAQGAKKMGRLPDIVLWAGWDRSLRQEGVKGGHLSSSLHLACVWMCIPGTLWVGKVGFKDGLEWPSSAIGPSLFGSMGPGAGQVKTQTNYQVGQSVHSAPRRKVHPYHMPTKQDTNPQQQWSKSSLFRPMIKQSYLWHHHLPVAPSSCAVQCHSLPMVPLLRVPRVGLPAPALSPPTSPARPPPPSGHSRVGRLTPVPRLTPDLAQARSAPLFLDHHLLWHW